MRHFDKRLENYKYHPNYIHENVGFVKELIPEAAKYYRSNRCAFVVQLVDTNKEAYNRIMTSETIAEDFPNMRKLFGSSFCKCKVTDRIHRWIADRSKSGVATYCGNVQRA